MLWRIASIAALMMALVTSAHADLDDGRPFGVMGEKEFEAFARYASAHDVDLEAEMSKAYAGDPAGLARVFGLAASFQTLDANARAFGNLLFSTFLNIGESRGDAIFVKAIDLIPESERQRVRDFLFYPVLLTPAEHRTEAERAAREQFPRLFPSDYQFAKGDELFD